VSARIALAMCFGMMVSHPKPRSRELMNEKFVVIDEVVLVFIPRWAERIVDGPEYRIAQVAKTIPPNAVVLHRAVQCVQQIVAET